MSAPPLSITKVLVNLKINEVEIHGEHLGDKTEIKLSGQVLKVERRDPGKSVVVSLPSDVRYPGTYLLTATDTETGKADTIPLALGTNGPPGPQGKQGERGEKGEPGPAYPPLSNFLELAEALLRKFVAPPKPQPPVNTQSTPTGPRNSPNELVKQYVEACAQSSERARFLLITLVTASVITAVAAWNTQGDAWLTERINRATQALNLMGAGQDKIIDLNTRLSVLESKLAAGQALSEVERLELNALKNLKNKNLNDKELLTDYIQELRKIQVEKVNTLSVPFFGIVFDVNDLGIFSGITFIIILVLFRFSLYRELSNLVLTFDVARDADSANPANERQGPPQEQLLIAYEMLSMKQMLTQPPRRVPPPVWLGNWRPAQKFFRGNWNLLTKVLFFLPFVVHGFLCLHDARTRRFGDILNPRLMENVINWSLVFLSVILVLTGFCLYLSFRINQLWRKKATELGLDKNVEVTSE